MTVLRCPKCKGAIQSDPNLAGQQVSCPHCEASLVMPQKAKPDSPSKSTSSRIALIGTAIVVATLGVAIGWVVIELKDDSSPVVESPEMSSIAKEVSSALDEPMTDLGDFGKGAWMPGEESSVIDSEEAENEPPDAPPQQRTSSFDYSNVDYSLPQYDYSKGPNDEELIIRKWREKYDVTAQGFLNRNGDFVVHGLVTVWYEKTSVGNSGKKRDESYWYNGKKTGHWWNGTKKEI